MLLAIDTSTRRMGIALYDGAQVLSEMAWASNFHHTVQLAPTVAQALKNNGLTMANVRGLAVALGPGSFTSLRVGLAFAKGLALARHIPILGVPSLDILAAAQPLSEKPLAALLEAGRKRLAVGWYRVAESNWQPDKAMEVMTLEALSQRIRQPTIVCGEMNAQTRKVLQRKRKNVQLASPAQSQRRPAYLAELAWDRWQAGGTDNVHTLAPIYLSQDGQS